MFQPPHFDRRTLLERLMLLTGAALVPALGTMETAHAAEASAGLGAQELKLLAAVADTIVPRTDTPGAVDAGVPAAFEALLVNWASAQRRMELTRALSAIDRHALETEGADFVALPPDRRLMLLTAYDAAAIAPGAPGSSARGPATDAAYPKLKELIVILYYLSEAALTHELEYVHTPGEWRPSVPRTAETRAVGGGIF